MIETVNFVEMSSHCLTEVFTLFTNSEEANLVDNLQFNWEDCLKRKAQLKKGKRPAVGQKYF